MTPPKATTEHEPEPTRSLASKIAEVAGLMERLAHDKKMSQGGESYGYASIDAIADLTRPLFAERGVTIAPVGMTVVANDSITSKRGALGYRAVIVVEWLITDGVDRMRVESVGESIDYSDKAFGKAQTYARKALIVALLNMSTGEDPDAHRPDAGSTANTQGQATSQRRSSPAQGRGSRSQESTPSETPQQVHDSRLAALVTRAERDGLTRGDVETAITVSMGENALAEHALATDDGYTKGQAALREALVAAGKLPG